MPELFVDRVQPTLNFLPPDYQPWLRHLANGLLPFLLRSKGVAEVESCQVETLVNLYHQFQLGQTRLLLAFRHPSTVDPFVIAHLLWRDLPRTARSMGVSLRQPTHTHFIYDRGIPLWAGNLAAWALPKLGGTSIQRGKVDRPGLKSARELLLRGRFPLAAAPEGATNNHSEIVSPLEPGIAQMAFWCCEDLAAAGQAYDPMIDRGVRVAIVPLGLRYAYVSPPWAAIDRLLADVEADLGVADSDLVIPGQTTGPGSHDRRYLRLYRLGDRLATIMEEFYRKAYGLKIATTIDLDSDDGQPNQALAQRLDRLLDLALGVAETYFGISAKGSREDRCRRLEQAGWDRIYCDDGSDRSPVERGLANWLASEASSRMGHMRLVERFNAVTGHYVREKPSPERFAETLLILWRACRWLQGRSPSEPPILGPQRAYIEVCQPLWASDRFANYRSDRRSTIAELTKDLQSSLNSAF